MPEPRSGRDQSWFVISDTHLGLAPNRYGNPRNIAEKDEAGKGTVLEHWQSEPVCEPDHLGQFFDWLIRLKNGELSGPEKTVQLVSGTRSTTRVLEPPEKLIMTGDILELWDSTDREVDFCARPILNQLDNLSCEKIYVLGNHDYDMRTLAGNYPSGKRTLQVLDEYYPSQEAEEQEGGAKNKSAREIKTVSKGGRDYLFAHGHQFDKRFVGFALWKRIGMIRSVHNALRDYSKIILALLGLSLFALTDPSLSVTSVLLSLATSIVLFSYFGFKRASAAAIVLLYVWGAHLSNIVSPLLSVDSPDPFSAVGLAILRFLVLIPRIVSDSRVLFLLAVISLPSLVYVLGIKIARIRGVRYNEEAARIGVKTWWKIFSDQKVSPSNLVVVYGHTHSLRQYSKEKLGLPISALNLPSWTKDLSSRQLLRDVFLYIDNDGELFLGWDSRKGKPFHIPIEIVQESAENRKKWKEKFQEIKQKGEVSRAERTLIKTRLKKVGYIPREKRKKLEKIGWPDPMIRKWTAQSTAE